MNYTLTCFSTIFPAAYFAIEPNSATHLIFLSSLSFFLSTLISFATAFSIIILLTMSKYLELVTTCD